MLSLPGSVLVSASARVVASAAVCVLSCGALGAQWRSQLYPSDWRPGLEDPQGRFLHDFSFAGYHAGEKAIPDVVPGPVVDVTAAPYLADPTGVADATSAIQAAIDFVAGQGGGVVFLPAGTFRLTFGTNTTVPAALWVHGDGVVLRGAGRQSTRLFLDETVTRQRQIVLFRPQAGGHWYQAVGSAIAVVRDLPNQTLRVPVPDPAAFQVGEWIALRCDCTAAFIAEHRMQGVWDSTLAGVVFYRRIDAISALDSTLTLDAPTRYPMLTRDNLRIYRVLDPIDEVGLEDLALGMRQNTTPGFGDEDYDTPGTGAYEVHGSNAVLFAHARNAWVRRVDTYRPPTNPSPVTIHSDGIVLSHARWVTVSDCQMARPQFKGGGGNGYGFVLQGADCLLVDDHAEQTRHSFSFKSLRTSGNVLLRCRSTNSRLALDFHMHLSMANLLDNVVLDRDFIEASYRPYGELPFHGYTTTQSVIWNTQGLAYASGRSSIVDSRQYGHGYVIGTRGAATGVVVTPTLVSGHETAPVDWTEGIGAGALLEPGSLYEDQLVRRRRETARWTPIGSGCGGSGVPAPTLALHQGQRPQLGTTFVLALTKPSGAPTAGLLGITAVGPIDLTPIGMAGCHLYTAIDLVLALSVAAPGVDLWSLPVPADANLLGATFFQQALAVVPGANGAGLLGSNAGEARIGER